MRYYYKIKVYFDQLKGDMGEAPESNEILENTIGDDYEMMKELKSYNKLSQEFRDSVEKIEHDVEIDERVTSAYDEDEIGTTGTIIITLITNKELSDKELEMLNEFYCVDDYWQLFDEVKFELYYTEE